MQHKLALALGSVVCSFDKRHLKKLLDGRCLKRPHRMIHASGIALLMALSLVVPASAQSVGATIRGVLVDQNGSLPIAGAKVKLEAGTVPVATTVTDAAGAFMFAGEPPQTYTVVISGPGLSSTTFDLIDVHAAQVRTVRFAISRSATGPNVIGRTQSVSAVGPASLQTSSTITQSVNSSLLQNQNYMRLGDGLATLPGVNVSATSSANIGDDLYMDIRGFGPGETQTLLDGHPIGPFGVGVAAVGAGGYNFQDSPLFALSRAEVTYGSGAGALYGVDAIGGSIDQITVDPTIAPQVILRQSVGDQGRLSTALQASGTFGKLSAVVLHGVQGTYGVFSPTHIAQTGTITNGNLTSANLQGIVEAVSGDYKLNNDLAKIRYALTPATSLTFTAFSATSWDDKTGNGDNNFSPPDYVAYTAQQNLGKGGCAKTQVPITTDSGHSCMALSQYAQIASGPAGGGSGTWQALQNQDYDARLRTQIGPHAIVLDSFVDNYALDYNRDASWIACGFRVCNNILSTNNTYRTYGSLLSDDIASQSNDVGFGVYSQHQTNIELGSGFRPAYGGTNNNVFIRDAWTPPGQFSYFVNAWYKHYNANGNSSVDPRASVVYRPTKSDVVRATAGGSLGEPAMSTLFGAPIIVPPALLPTVSPIHCGVPTAVAQVSNPSVGPEKASDIELSYGHRFPSDAIAQVVLYDVNETGKIFSGNLPASGVGSTLVGAGGPGYLNALAEVLGSICPGEGITPANVLDYASVSTTFNTATARTKGIEISGRVRARQSLYFDFSYDVQSSVLNDIPASILRISPTLINGAQTQSYPLHKASLGVDYANTHGFEGRIDSYYVGGNNPLNRQPYVFLNGMLSQAVGRDTVVNLGVYNITNSNTDNYGRLGLGVYVPVNSFFTSVFPNSLSEGATAERFGLPPTSFAISLTQRVGGP